MSGAVAVSLPPHVYLPMFEERLLIRTFNRLWREQGHQGLPPAFSMLSRNDLIAAAMNTLNQEHGELYAAFVDTVSQHVQEDSLYTFPSPRALPASPSEAELLAYQLLQEGQGSYWPAVRQVASLLVFGKGRRAIGSDHMSFVLGAYGHRCFTGLLHSTDSHQCVCLLFNAFIALIQPTLTWTTVTVNVDFAAPIHTDNSNAPFHSLLVGISHFENGQLWAHCPGGCDYEEHHGHLLSGRTFDVSGAAVLLRARDVPHKVQPWHSGNRFTLIAHTIGQYAHLKPDIKDFLLGLNFSLPGERGATVPIPCV